jgi:cbb3-type cytochrome oxidase maturation protein
MEILTILIPVSLLLGGIGLVAFIWAMKTRQFDDPAGDANRILVGEWDLKPKPTTSIGGTDDPATGQRSPRQGLPPLP